MSDIKRCYVFAIGGSGARVLEAITIQLAAGCGYEVLKNWEIVPIMIDLDSENGNTSVTRNLLNTYMEIHDTLKFSRGESSFFKVPIKRLKDVSEGAESDTFTMPVDLTNKASLKQMIDYETLSTSTKLATTENLVDLLFAEQELNMTLQHGFKGRPNIGSIVFGQFGQRYKDQNGKELFKNKDFSAFAHGFKEGDRIFVMGSIFGGTGAAGIPWLIKEIRNYKEVDAFRNAKIGLLSIMPYFTVSKNDSSTIDSKTFITKTKSALRYYHKNLTEPNAIFYLADDNDNMEHKNAEGGVNQKNQPHFVEFIGATSLTKFLSLENEQLDNEEPSALRYGIRIGEGNQPIFLENFDPQKPSYKWINLPLTRFYIAHLLILKVFKKSNNITWKLQTGLTEKRGTFFSSEMIETFFSQNFYRSFEGFFEHFNKYLIEISGDSGKSGFKAFRPYMVNPNVGEKKLDDKRATPLNEIINNNNISNGTDTIDKIDYKKDETTYFMSSKKIKWAELVTNTNSCISQVNQLTHEDESIQKAIRLDELLFQSSTKFLSKYKVPFLQ